MKKKPISIIQVKWGSDWKESISGIKSHGLNLEEGYRILIMT